MENVVLKITTDSVTFINSICVSGLFIKIIVVHKMLAEERQISLMDSR